MKHVTSRANALVAQCRAIAQGKARSLILLDGVHLVGEALDAGVHLERLVATAEASGREEIGAIIHRAERAGTEVLTATSSVMAAITPVRTPSGIVAVAARPRSAADRVYAGAGPLVLIACDIQDPGNLGAMIRVAEAAGASGVVAAGASADPFGWKALRGSMGSALRLPLVSSPQIDEAVAEARRHRCRLLAAVLSGGTLLAEAELTGPLAVLIGGEGTGLPSRIVHEADGRLTIPMEPPVESLNATVTAALILYESRRHRLSGAKEKAR
jgi:TrmH family RNA methyltransferase